MDRHPLKIGAKVAIHNATLSGKPIIEGVAVIVAITETRDQYAVRFENEQDEIYERFINPDEPVIEATQ